MHLRDVGEKELVSFDDVHLRSPFGAGWQFISNERQRHLDCLLADVHEFENPVEDDVHYVVAWYSDRPGNVFAPNRLRYSFADACELRRKFVRRTEAERSDPGDGRGPLKDRFHELVRWWIDENRFTSSPVTLVMHPAYQQIIGLGPEVIPLLLEDLASDPKDWSWALKALTGEDVARGTQSLDAAAEAWLEWGRARGYIGE